MFQAESPDYDTKYNLNHLNEIAKILKCSAADFMPTPPVKQNTIEEFSRLHPKQKAKNEKMSQDNEKRGLQKSRREGETERGENNSQDQSQNKEEEIKRGYDLLGANTLSRTGLSARTRYPLQSLSRGEII